LHAPEFSFAGGYSNKAVGPSRAQDDTLWTNFSSFSLLCFD